MTHDGAIATVLGVLGLAELEETAKRELAEAEEHVANCKDCWGVVCSIYEKVTGRAPHDAERMHARFACERYRDDLWMAVGLEPGLLTAEMPEIAQHLAGCQACREELASIADLDDAAIRDEDGAATVSAWRTVASTAGETVHELIEQVRVRVQGAIASFDVSGALLAPNAITVRGEAGKRRGGSAAQDRGRLPLGESGCSVAFDVVAAKGKGPKRVQLSLKLEGRENQRVAVELRSIEADDSLLLIRDTVPIGQSLTFSVPCPGAYELGIKIPGEQERFVIPVTIRGEK